MISLQEHKYESLHSGRRTWSRQVPCERQVERQTGADKGEMKYFIAKQSSQWEPKRVTLRGSRSLGGPNLAAAKPRWVEAKNLPKRWICQ
jgi:hypothetical protein